ncbi:MAG: S9 family peptidase [Propionibacteriaceae bacterium]|nr:S9 family peptidase [Propionibacteriaceae bacterium]
MPTSGAERPRPITRGTTDSAPQFSPDGAWLAFLRGVSGSPQLAVVEADGGEPRILTDAPLGVESFAWAPSSDRLAFVARNPEPGRYGTREGIGAEQEDPRLITDNKYQANGLGYTRDRPRGIYVLDVPCRDEEPWLAPTGRAARAPEPEAPPGFGGRNGLPTCRLLTPAGADCNQPEFAPDGAFVYFAAALHAEEDDDLRVMVHRVPIGGGEPELVAGGPADQWSYHHPRFSRDGVTLFMFCEEVGPDGLDFVGRSLSVAAMPADGSRPPQRLTLPEVDYTAPWGFLEPYGPDAMLAPARVRGMGELHAIRADGTVENLASGPRVVKAAAERAGSLVAIVSDPGHPAELAVLRQRELAIVTDFSRSLLEAASPVQPQELTVAGPDGQAVHGWVFLPAGPGPHPVLLTIHGGPFANYDWAFFDEAQVYAAAGYAVVQCNPRGSASYGVTHGRAVKERLGTVDMADVLAFLDGACTQLPDLDPARVGIMGGSYGGYLTAWIIAHDHRFAAAIVERGYLDPAAFVGTSDIGWFFSDAYVGTDPRRIAEQSPYEKVRQVITPTLIIHSENDLRCPLEQAQRYFAALRRGGVGTRMLIFPGENHELSRSGTPWHRRQRFAAILDWWNEHLPVQSKEVSDAR